MKISREEKIMPITITIETQNELDSLFELSGSVRGIGKTRDFFDEIYTNLKDLGAKNQHQLRGLVEVE